jgi:hypothetical protein
MSLTGAVTKGWEKGRFNDPYMRDSMQDFGIMTDTLECCVNWSNMNRSTPMSEKVLQIPAEHDLHDPPLARLSPRGEPLFHLHRQDE